MNLRYNGHLVSQGTGALNDNLYREVFAFLVIAGAGSQAEAGSQVALFGLCFMLPFILMAPLAGCLSDRLPPHWLLRGIRVVEPLLCALGASAIATGSTGFMMASIAAFGMQSALFSPLKYAIVPDLVADRQLDVANGRLSAATQVAILLGMILAMCGDGELLQGTVFASWPPATTVLLISLGFSLLGIRMVWRIGKMQPRNPQTPIRPFSWWQQISVLHADRRLWLPAIGLAGFWAVAAVINVVMKTVATHQFGAGLSENAQLAVGLGLAIGLSSLLTPLLNVRRSPAALPLISVGGLGVSLFCSSLAAQNDNYTGFVGWLYTAAAFIAWWPVCMNVLLQRRSPVEIRGRVFAGIALLGNLGVIIGFSLMAVLSSYLPSALTLQLIAVAIGGGLAIGLLRHWRSLAAWVCLVPLRVLFRVEEHHLDRVPEQGGVLLIANHLSFADGLILTLAAPRPVRFLVHSPYMRMPIIGFFMRSAGCVAIDGSGSRRALVDSIRQAGELLRAGEAVCIFPEGRLSRSGGPGSFGKGSVRIASETGVPIVPVALDGLMGSVFSRSGWRYGSWLHRRVRVVVGELLPADTPLWQQRQHICERLTEARELRAAASRHTLASRALTSLRRRWSQTVIADADGSLTGGKLLIAAHALYRLLPLERDEHTVGVLLPAGRGGSIVNLALAMGGHCAVNANPTTGPDGVAEQFRRAGVRTVINAKAYSKRFGITELPQRLLEIRELLPQLGRWRLIRAAIATRLLPAAWLLKQQRADADAQWLFSSGSTGKAKAVALTHRQILSNIDAAIEHLGAAPDQDRLFSALPLFHCFGLNTSMWLCLCSNITSIAHVDPRDGKTIGRLIQEHGATFLVSTPTFLRSNLRRASAEQLASLRFAVVGAERCPEDLHVHCAEHYRFELLEGYGATELSPVVACNQPAPLGAHDVVHRQGSVGRTLPGVSLRIVDIDSGEPLPPGAEGLILLRSPSLMRAYADDAETTGKAVQDGWYHSGDVGHTDEAGFLHLTARLSRFAKIGGEMVPLDRVEEALRAHLPASETEPEQQLAVTAVADTGRGERLLVLHTRADLDAQTVLAGTKVLPPLFRPKLDDCHLVDELPNLPTGKRDLAGLKQLAEELTADPS